MNYSACRGRPSSPFGNVLATKRKGRSAALWHLQVVLLGFALVCGLLRRQPRLEHHITAWYGFCPGIFFRHAAGRYTWKGMYSATGAFLCVQFGRYHVSHKVNADCVHNQAFMISSAESCSGL